jgi:hypothetical protein
MQVVSSVDEINCYFFNSWRSSYQFGQENDDYPAFILTHWPEWHWADLRLLSFEYGCWNLAYALNSFPVKNAWSFTLSNPVVLSIFAARYQLIQAARFWPLFWRYLIWISLGTRAVLVQVSVHLLCVSICVSGYTLEAFHDRFVPNYCYHNYACISLVVS